MKIAHLHLFAKKILLQVWMTLYKLKQVDGNILLDIHFL